MSPWSGAQADQHLAGPDSTPLPRDRWKHLTFAQRRREAPKRLMPQLLDAPAPLPPISYRYTEITPQLCAEAQGHQIEAARRTDHNTPFPRNQPRAPGTRRLAPSRRQLSPGAGCAWQAGCGPERRRFSFCWSFGSAWTATAPPPPRPAPPVKGPRAPAPLCRRYPTAAATAAAGSAPEDHGSPRGPGLTVTAAPAAPRSPQAERTNR